VITIVGDGVERHFAISYGFAEVRKDKIIVMGETVEEATEIDKARAMAAQKKAEVALASVLTEEDFNKHQLKLQRSLVRQSIAQ
jgi:F-type H+-transporting ATPase subunit epsilon